jgi:hypothetical protein
MATAPCSALSGLVYCLAEEPTTRAFRRGRAVYAAITRRLDPNGWIGLRSGDDARLPGGNGRSARLLWASRDLLPLDAGIWCSPPREHAASGRRDGPESITEACRWRPACIQPAAIPWAPVHRSAARRMVPFSPDERKMRAGSTMPCSPCRSCWPLLQQVARVAWIPAPRPLRRGRAGVRIRAFQWALDPGFPPT